MTAPRAIHVVVNVDVSSYVQENGTLSAAGEDHVWATLADTGDGRSVRVVLGALRYYSARLADLLNKGLAGAVHVVIEGTSTTVLDSLARDVEQHRWGRS